MRWEELQAHVQDLFAAREKDSDQHAKGKQQGEGKTMHNNNKGKGQRCISIIVQEVL
jgi:hypothetical protein